MAFSGLLKMAGFQAPITGWFSAPADKRLVLTTLLDLQGDSAESVEDTRLAATKMFVQDVRDWLETLDGKGFVERTRLTVIS
jgi:hypothetical protein